MRRCRIVLAFVILASLLAACSNPATTLAPAEITLNALDIRYEVVTLEVVVGQPVKLSLKNTGALEHDFNIAEIEVVDKREESSSHAHDPGAADSDLHVAAAPGTTATLEFTPTEAGTYEFFCSTAGHKEAGMVGQLIVKAAP